MMKKKIEIAEKRDGMARKTIAVVGISRSAGTTFVATSLAFFLSKDVEAQRTAGEQPACVSYVECRRPRAGEGRVYHAASLDRRFSSRRFTDYFAAFHSAMPGSAADSVAVATAPGGLRERLLPDRPAGERLNLHKGINWVVHGEPVYGEPGTEEDFAAAVRAQEAAEPERWQWLFDLPGQFVVADSPPTALLRRFDLTVAVIDPRPDRLLAGAARYEELRDAQMSGLPVLWVMNKDNAGINHREAGRFLQMKAPDALLPLYSGEVFYRSQFGCGLPAELLEADGNAEALQELQRRVATELQVREGVCVRKLWKV